MTDEWRKDCELWLNYGLQKSLRSKDTSEAEFVCATMSG